jgi:hypothetical protein
MRQVGDTLIWLAMISVVVAVVYFTPRLASYVAASMATEHGTACVTCRDITIHQDDESTP